MRPLAPAKPSSTTTTMNKSTNNNTSKPRTLAPAPPKIAPGSRPLKPLIAAKVLPSQQRIHSTTTRKLAPLVPTKSGKDEITAKQSAPVILAPKVIPTPSTSSISKQSKRLEEERDQISIQEDYESAVSDDDDEFSDNEESQSPSSSTTNMMSGDKVQPKKEWVLPARAKPGRKPSEVEPPTKRKAQNRASQRAFRERRQSYLASLEAKVNEYEERGINYSTELQKIAKRLKEENDVLKQENTSLHAKIQQLEISLALQSPTKSIKVEDDVLMNSPQSTSARHESGMPVSMLLEDAPRKTSWDWSVGSNRAGQSSIQTSPDEQGLATEIQRDCGFCTEQSPCVCSGEAVLDFNNTSTRSQAHHQSSSLPLRGHLERRAINRQKLWYTIPASQQQHNSIGRQVQICPTSTNIRRMNGLRVLHNQPSPMMIRSGGGGSSMLPPLQSPRKSNLWPIYPLTSPNKNITLSSSSPQMQFSRSSGGPQTPPLEPTIFRMKKVLPGSTPAVCSGDPSDCAACATDPALAAFCRAVSTHLEGEGIGNAVMLDAGNAIPLRKRRIRGMSTSTNTNIQRMTTNTTPLQLTPQSLYTNGRNPLPPSTRPKLWSISQNNYQGEVSANAKSISTNSQSGLHSLRRHTTSDVRRETETQSTINKEQQRIESIPQAWQRIKQHPSFANWQGGLDLLADVVTRKSSSDEEEERRSNTSQSPIKEAQQPSPTEEDLGRKRRQTKEAENAIQSQEKRRKLYVDRRRVDDVLALMDRGTPSMTESPQPSQTPPNDSGQPCACPLSKIM